MGKILDISGQKFGRLTAEYPIKKNGRIAWHCKCDCGNECDVDGANLRGGKQISCGCAKKEGHNAKDITNQKFGLLTAIEPTKDRQGGSVVWKCQCDCGNICYVTAGNLRSGHTKSCGCAIGKFASEKQYIDLKGQRFGKLIALEYIKPDKEHPKSRWKCQCDCGNICYVPVTCLRRSDFTMSCGCINSRGEQVIAQILSENNINFEMHKSFPDCRFPETNALARFDFYIDNKYLIEYDGKYHYEGWKNDLENLKIVQQRDNYKTTWCKEKNIPLIRIPYYKLHNITIQDLIL